LTYSSYSDIHQITVPLKFYVNWFIPNGRYVLTSLFKNDKNIAGIVVAKPGVGNSGIGLVYMEAESEAHPSGSVVLRDTKIGIAVEREAESVVEAH